MVYTLSYIGLFLIAAIKFGQWKNWKDYLATIWFFIAGNLLYHFLYHQGLLWVLGVQENNIILELANTYILFPSTIILLLSHYPNKWYKHVLKVSLFIVIYMISETIASLLGEISYQNNWILYWSFIWDVLMFTILYLHYKHPIIAYLLAALMGIGMITLFPIQLKY